MVLPFECRQVKSAYHKLTDQKQRDVIVMNIEYVQSELDKERRRLISKGVSHRRSLHFIQSHSLDSSNANICIFFYIVGERVELASL